MKNGVLEELNELRYIDTENASVDLLAPIGAVALYFPIYYIGKTEIGRGSLPDPVDMFNHFGNIGPSLMVGTLVGAAIAGGAALEKSKLSSNWLQTKRRLKAAVNCGSFAAGAALNGYAESALGSTVHYDGATNYGDFKDWAWGTLATILGARLTTRFGRNSTD